MCPLSPKELWDASVENVMNHENKPSEWYHLRDVGSAAVCADMVGLRGP